VSGPADGQPDGIEAGVFYDLKVFFFQRYAPFAFARGVERVAEVYAFGKEVIHFERVGVFGFVRFFNQITTGESEHNQGSKRSDDTRVWFCRLGHNLSLQ
jgi:hypothetical protein